MVTHVVIFTWKAGRSRSEIDVLRSALDRLATRLAPAATLLHGSDLAFRGGNGDYGLVAQFPDREAWQAYQADPEHKALVDTVISPMLASRVAIQF